jgi:hypothetical protein
MTTSFRIFQFTNNSDTRYYSANGLYVHLWTKLSTLSIAQAMQPL